MSNEIQQAGIFRGRIVSYGLNEAESGAKSVFITVEIDEIFENNEWFDWQQYDFHASGDIWVVKRDGTLNERQVRSLIDDAGWEGSFVSIGEGTWDPKPVQIVVDEDSYKDNVRYRISWVNAYDRVPGGGNMSPDKVNALQKQFGPQLRALAGNASRNAAPPAGEPAKPKPAKSSAKPARGRGKATNTEYSQPEATAPPAPATAGDDIPF